MHGIRGWMAIMVFFVGGVTATFGQFSVNVGAVSDYVWRGYSQTEEDPTVQAGVDYSFASGLYVGAWASPVKFYGDDDVEVDAWAGYYKEYDNGFAWDLGYTWYIYQDFDDTDEAYLGLTYKMFTLKYYRGFEVETDYIEGNVSIPLPAEFGLELHYGDYAFPDSSWDYSDWKVGITKTFFNIDFELAFTDTDVEGDDIYDSRVALSAVKTWSFGD